VQTQHPPPVARNQERGLVTRPRPETAQHPESLTEDERGAEPPRGLARWKEIR